MDEIPIPEKANAGKSTCGIDNQRRLLTRTVLEELYCLLEKYCPPWYREEHRSRAVAALKGPLQISTSDPSDRLPPGS